MSIKIIVHKTLDAQGRLVSEWKAKAMDGGYKCYLLQTHSYFPFWIAQFDFKGHEFSNKTTLRNHMSVKLKKALIGGQYIFK